MTEIQLHDITAIQIEPGTWARGKKMITLTCTDKDGKETALLIYGTLEPIAIQLGPDND